MERNSQKGRVIDGLLQRMNTAEIGSILSVDVVYRVNRESRLIQDNGYRLTTSRGTDDHPLAATCREFRPVPNGRFRNPISLTPATTKGKVGDRGLFAGARRWLKLEYRV